MSETITTLTWGMGSAVSAELLGYGLHRLLHSGWVGFLSRNHMKHHLLVYGPLREQRSKQYHDATTGSVSLGNIGLEWLLPASVLVVAALGLFNLLHARPLHQLIFFAVTLGWSFLMFSYLHDVQHIDGFWMERNRILKRWFLAARNLHEIHHAVINDQGLMDKNFGIGFFFFDRIFGTLARQRQAFNERGYRAARQRFESVLKTRSQ